MKATNLKLQLNVNRGNYYCDGYLCLGLIFRYELDICSGQVISKIWLTLHFSFFPTLDGTGKPTKNKTRLRFRISRQLTNYFLFANK